MILSPTKATLGSVLGCILRRGQARPTEIAQELGSPVNAVTSQLFRLRRMGLVTKDRGYYTLSDRGREVVGRAGGDELAELAGQKPRLSWVFWLGIATLVLMALSSGRGRREEREEAKPLETGEEPSKEVR